MKVLIIDPHGDALDWAIRIRKHGHELRHFIKDTPRTCHIGAGLVPVVRDYRPLAWADLIIMADNVLYLKEIDSCRLLLPHDKIVGPTARTAAWETDREEGCMVIEEHGIETIPFQMFDNYDSAISYVKKQDRRFVSKPCGDADKALSYVSGGPDPVRDMVYMLEKWKKSSALKDSFMIQDFIEGIEMGIDGWFGPHGFDRGWSESFEFKKLMPGNYGVNTGEMGSVLRFVAESKLADMVLGRLAGELERERYAGYISINCIIDGKGKPWPLEFTMRPGFPTINIEQEIHANDDPADRLMALATGHDCRSIVPDQVSCGFVVAGKDFPHSRTLIKDIDGIPVFGTNEVGDKHLHPCQIRAGKLTEFETAGDYNFVVTGSGKTVAEAKRKAFERVKKIHIPGGETVRIDIGERLKKELPKLHALGFALGMEYEDE
jgi:phosphoribosylamine---glycine ligase